jgi:hypothetical protein
MPDHLDKQDRALVWHFSGTCSPTPTVLSAHAARAGCCGYSNLFCRDTVDPGGSCDPSQGVCITPDLDGACCSPSTWCRYNMPNVVAQSVMVMATATHLRANMAIPSARGLFLFVVGLVQIRRCVVQLRAVLECRREVDRKERMAASGGED